MLTIRKSWVFIIVAICVHIKSATSEFEVDDFDVFDESSVQNFIQIYKSGVEAYLANDFGYCVDRLEKALYEYHIYYEAVTFCRIQCEFDAQRISPFMKEDLEHLHFYEEVIRIALCLRKCKKEKLPELPTYFSVGAWVKEAFNSRKPYEYLHLCYNKVSLYI